MIDILRERYINRTRKSHKCTGCMRTFEPPHMMWLCVTAQEGTVYNDYFCPTCEYIRVHRANQEPSGWFEFSEGDLLEEALERESEAQKRITQIITEVLKRES